MCASVLQGGWTPSVMCVARGEHHCHHVHVAKWVSTVHVCCKVSGYCQSFVLQGEWGQSIMCVARWVGTVYNVCCKMGGHWLSYVFQVGWAPLSFILQGGWAPSAMHVARCY